MNAYRVVEQVGDVTFAVPGHEYNALDTALIAAVDLTVRCDEEREYFVDGPGLDQPIGVGPAKAQDGRTMTKRKGNANA